MTHGYTYTGKCSMHDKSENICYCANWQWTTIGWCYSTALEAVPLMQLSNTSLEWFIVKYHKAICSRYNSTLINWVTLANTISISSDKYRSLSTLIYRVASEQSMLCQNASSLTMPIYWSVHKIFDTIWDMSKLCCHLADDIAKYILWQ